MGEGAGAIVSSRFVVFGQRQPLLFGGPVPRQFGEDCLGGLFVDGVAEIWIGLKTGYQQNCLSTWTK